MFQMRKVDEVRRIYQASQNTCNIKNGLIGGNHVI